VTEKVADFLLSVPVVSENAGEPETAVTALRGMETPAAYVDPCGVITKFVVFPTVHKVASLM